MTYRWLADGAEEWRFLDGELFCVVPAAVIKCWYPGARFVEGRWID